MGASLTLPPRPKLLILVAKDNVIIAAAHPEEDRPLAADHCPAADGYCVDPPLPNTRRLNMETSRA